MTLPVLNHMEAIKIAHSKTKATKEVPRRWTAKRREMWAKKTWESTKVRTKLGLKSPETRNAINDFHFAELDDEEGEEEEEEIGHHGIINAEEDEVIEETPADCFPEHVYVRFPFLAGDDDAPFWQGWANLRLKTFQLIENKYFETAVITMILLSSLALVSWCGNRVNHDGIGMNSSFEAHSGEPFRCTKNQFDY